MNTMEKIDELVTIAEAVKLLGLSRQSIWIYRRIGLLKPTMIAGKVFFERREVLRCKNTLSKPH